MTTKNGTILIVDDERFNRVEVVNVPFVSVRLGLVEQIDDLVEYVNSL